MNDSTRICAVSRHSQAPVRAGSQWWATRGGLLVALCLAGFSATAQTFGPSDLTGSELFARYCAACHGPEGLGDGPVAATLNRLVPDLTRLTERYEGEFPVTEIRAFVDGRSPLVAHGPRTMPVWGYEFWAEEGADIEAEERANETIERLIEFLASIQVVETDDRLPRESL